MSGEFKITYRAERWLSGGRYVESKLIVNFYYFVVQREALHTSATCEMERVEKNQGPLADNEEMAHRRQRAIAYTGALGRIGLKRRQPQLPQNDTDEDSEE